MGHVRDRWTVTSPAGRKVHGPRWGNGKRWQARWVEGGVERSASFATKDEATTHVARMEAGLAPEQGVASGVTLGEYAAGWLAGRVRLRPSSVKSISSRITNQITPALGGKRLNAITRKDVQNAVAEWSRELAPQTVKATYGTLSQILKSAELDKLITKSPCEKIETPRKAFERVVPLTDEQVHEIADTLPHYLRAMAIVGAATGLRCGELRGLTVDRVRGGLVEVDRQLSQDATTFGPVKTTAGHRTVALGAVAQAALDEHLATYGVGPRGLIFRSAKNLPLSNGAANRAWERMRAKVGGLRDRSGWHDLRHYNASLLIAAGLSVRAVADRLGHEDPSVTLKVYAHLWPSDQSNAVAAIDAALAKPVAPVEPPAEQAAAA